MVHPAFKFMCNFALGKVITGNAGERPANGRTNAKCMPPAANGFSFAKGGFFQTKPKTIMKYKIQVIRRTDGYIKDTCELTSLRVSLAAYRQLVLELDTDIYDVVMSVLSYDLPY